MKDFKNWYSERKGKYILFFGFYLIFFIVLGVYLGSYDSNKPKENVKSDTSGEVITTYDISNLINNDYEYKIKIIDNEESITFEGTKNNVDYANYEYKYFLDIYNINQLLKRSKHISNENLLLKYELNNSEINDVLLTQKDEGINSIEVYVDEETHVQEIIMDLTNYFGKDEYVIEMFYSEVDVNEDSSS